MTGKRLKLKQASAVLQVQPKELQNLVQFGVVRPKKSGGIHVFDARALLIAKLALYLRDSLGTPTSVLSRLMEAFNASEEKLSTEDPNYIVFNFRFVANEEPIRLGVPFRALRAQLEERMCRAELYKDLPRGRKRRGWRKQFLQSLSEAAKDIGEISTQKILDTIRDYRKEKRAPEITVVAQI
jgi:hypothetical protein